MARRTPLARTLLAVLAASLAIASSPPALADDRPGHRPPVDAPMVDPFRAPDSAWGPGNRGLEYATEPGTPVQATADGVVAFAGLVAGQRHVTIRHADGIRTTYSFLDEVAVVVGQRLRQGDPVGVAGGRFHLGARRGDAYFDPAAMFEGGPAEVHLVPFDEPPGRGAAGERSAIRQLIGGAGDALGWAAEGVADRLLRGSGASIDWLRANGSQLLRTAAHYLEPMPYRVLTRSVAAWRRAAATARRRCTAADVPPVAPAGRRVAVLVAGLGSTSDTAAIDRLDTAALGYAPGDVVRLSYRGGRTPGTGSAFDDVDTRAYAASDTDDDLREAGARLADLVEELAAAAPGAPLAVYAHSQGGVVARLALIELERRHGVGWLRRVELVGTLGAPHGGADLATAVHAVGSTGLGSQVLDGVQVVGTLGIDDDSAALRQLGETSDLVRELQATPVPTGVRAVSIAARGDLTVAVPRTALPGGTQVVVSGDGPAAHDQLPGSRAAQRELALALAGQPPTCQTFRTALVDQLVGEAISFAEDDLGALAWLGALRHGKRPLGG